jgi:hypothetical protein
MYKDGKLQLIEKMKQKSIKRLMKTTINIKENIVIQTNI